MRISTQQKKTLKHKMSTEFYISNIKLQMGFKLIRKPLHRNEGEANVSEPVYESIRAINNDLDSTVTSISAECRITEDDCKDGLESMLFIDGWPTRFGRPPIIASLEIAIEESLRNHQYREFHDAGVADMRVFRTAFLAKVNHNITSLRGIFRSAINFGRSFTEGHRMFYDTNDANDIIRFFHSQLPRNNEDECARCTILRCLREHVLQYGYGLDWRIRTSDFVEVLDESDNDEEDASMDDEDDVSMNDEDESSMESDDAATDMGEDSDNEI